VRRAALIVGLVMLSVAFAFGGYKDAFAPDIDSPPIEYGTRAVTDAVSRLNLQIQQGKVHLKFDGEQGYLRSVLKALDVPIQSQLVVFSKTSFQMYRISPSNPRSLYFNDSVAVGWVRGGPIVELAAEDPKQGVIFYTLDQKPAQQPQFVRHDDTCLACHESTAAVGVPGMLVRSVYPSRSGMPLEELGGYVTDDRSPFEQRWGGWYVTGVTGSMRHMGNGVVTDPSRAESIFSNQTRNLESLKGKFDTDAYLSPYSDIVALMVFEHEMHVMNLFTRAGWEVRYSEYEDRTTDSPVDRLGTTEAVLRVGAFTVTAGSVDVVGGALYGSLCVAPESGNCVDLDGTTNAAGTISSGTLTLAPGTYTLSFDLIGSQRGATDSTTVTLGSLYDQTFVLASGDDTTGIVSDTFTVTSTTDAQLIFTSNTPGNAGSLLDNVDLVATPEPATLSLMAVGLLGLLGLRRFAIAK
jgi:PEP-CTERM motif-containing protein